MIDGFTVPFSHNSQWNTSDITNFRHAVYRYYKPLPGSDTILFLRELCISKNKLKRTGSWEALELICSKVCHLNTIGDRFKFIRTLLIFVNVLLESENYVSRGGIELINPGKQYLEQKKNAQKATKDSMRAYVDEVNNALERMKGKQKITKVHRPLDLNKIPEIETYSPLFKASRDADKPEVRMVITPHEEGTNFYEFSAVGQIGWYLCAGSPSNDLYKHDELTISLG